MLCDDLKEWDGEGGRKAQEGGNICIHTASVVAQNQPAMWETWVQSLGWEVSPGGGHGNPLQCSCLENILISWASLVAQMVKNLPAMQETWVRSLEDPWRRKWEPSPVFLPR